MWRHRAPRRERGHHLIHRLAIRDRSARNTRANFNCRILWFHFQNVIPDEIDGKRNVDSTRSTGRRSVGDAPPDYARYNATDALQHPMTSSRCPLFLALLLVAYASLPISGCSKTADQSLQQRDSIAALLAAYVNGYKTGDWARVRFAADVIFEGPLKGPIRGESAVRTFLSSVRAKDVRVKRQIIDGEFVCVLADFETAQGTVVPFCEFFRIKDGQIAEIRPYFDPRPLIR